MFVVDREGLVRHDTDDGRVLVRVHVCNDAVLLRLFDLQHGVLLQRGGRRVLAPTPVFEDAERVLHEKRTLFALAKRRGRVPRQLGFTAVRTVPFVFLVGRVE